MSESQGNGSLNPQGTATPEGSQGNSTPAPTEEEFNKRLNAAISARSKALEAKFETKLNEVVSSFETKLAEATKKPEQGLPTNPESIVAKADAAKMAQLEKRIADMQASRDASEAKVRDRDLRGTLGEVLTKLGVDPARMKVALGYLVDSVKSVGFDEGSDTPVFRDTDGSKDLETGLKAWVASDEGRFFLPPTGAKGSGDPLRGNTPNAGNGAPSTGELVAKLLNFG